MSITICETLKITATKFFAHLLTAAALLCCGEVSDAAAETRYSTVDGKVIYNKLCAGCHGLYGKPPPEALLLYDPAPRPLLSGRFAYGESHQEIFETILEGKGRNMLSFSGRLTPEQISAVAHYVILLKDAGASQPERNEPPPSAPAPTEAEPPAPPQ